MTKIPNPLPTNLAHLCREAEKAVRAVMLTSRARALVVELGSNALLYYVDRRQFDQVFEGMPVTTVPALAVPGRLRKVAQVTESSQFYCLIDETPEEQIARIFDLVAPDKKAAVVAELMARVGREG